jgi:hypothetical protein
VERRTERAGTERRCGWVDGSVSRSWKESGAWRRERARRRRSTGREVSGTWEWGRSSKRRNRVSAGSGGEWESRRWERSGVRRDGEVGRMAVRSGGIAGACVRRRRARCGTVGARSRGAAHGGGGGGRRAGMGKRRSGRSQRVVGGLCCEQRNR